MLVELVLSLIITGTATFYGPGVMDQVYANRLTWRHVQPCAECIGMVALLDREHVGSQVWLQRPGAEVEGPFLVIDCANRAHREALIRRGWAVDVDWETGKRWGMRGPVPVSVLTQVPAMERVGNG